MDNNLIGEQITRYRKALNMTQEELGKAVGVSTQAVSRWENGGAPDVALLPAIADKLGVTIDALFGREGGEKVDIHETVARWLHAIPKEKRFDQICRLGWTLTKNLVDEISVPDIGYLDHAAMVEEETGLAGDWAVSRVSLGGGLILSLHAEDLSFATVWPEPSDGYDAHFASMEEYRTLFGILARPGCLELLEYFYSRPYRQYVPETVSHALGLRVEDAQALLDALADGLCILEKTDLELVDGLTHAYARHTDDITLVPFLYMARCVMQSGKYIFNIGGANKMLLRGGVWKREKENSHEKK